MTGLTYYKLTKGIYEGDVTKNCGLQGSEMDMNFFNLKSEDIKNAYWDKDTDELVLEYWREEIVTDKKGNKVSKNKELRVSGINPLGFKYDETTHELSGNKKDGTRFVIPGTFFTNNTLAGDGSIDNPLRVTSFNRTGVYAPVSKVVEGAGNLPTKPAFGDRLLLKEERSAYGKLYSWKEMQIIQQLLEEEGNGWRVATKEDFDQLLDAAEPCASDRNHSSLVSRAHGVYAGGVLKAKNHWEPSVTGGGTDEFGFTAIPAGFCDGSYDEKVDSEGNVTNIPHFDYFGKRAYFWTNTEEAVTKEVFVKSFEYNKTTVKCETEPRKNNYYKASIRLVNDKTTAAYETILGGLYPCYPMKAWDAINETYVPSKMWTTMNLDFRDKARGVKGFEPTKDTVTSYYVSEWDGEKWIKQEMEEGSSIVVTTVDGKPYIEYRLEHGELIAVSINVGENNEYLSVDEKGVITFNPLVHTSLDENIEMAETVGDLPEGTKVAEVAKLTVSETIEKVLFPDAKPEIKEIPSVDITLKDYKDGVIMPVGSIISGLEERLGYKFHDGKYNDYKGNEISANNKIGDVTYYFNGKRLTEEYYNGAVIKEGVNEFTVEVTYAEASVKPLTAHGNEGVVIPSGVTVSESFKIIGEYQLYYGIMTYAKAAEFERAAEYSLNLAEEQFINYFEGNFETRLINPAKGNNIELKSVWFDDDDDPSAGEPYKIVMVFPEEFKLAKAENVANMSLLSSGKELVQLYMDGEPKIITLVENHLHPGATTKVKCQIWEMNIPTGIGYRVKNVDITKE